MNRGHQTVKNGQLCKRSILMTEARARAFRACQQGNPNVAWAEARRSNQANAPVNWYVLWQPRSTDILDEMFEQFQLDRVQRAEEQADVMSFYVVDTRPGLYLCVNDDLHGDQFHFVDTMPRECDCLDYRHRCLHLGASCHHMIGLDNWLAKQAADAVPDPAPVAAAAAPPQQTREERRADFLRKRDLDFA